METKLICVSQPTEYTGCKTAEELVAYCARVSNPSNQNNSETALKLVQYLIKNKHWSPLEMVSLTIEINTTRDIARQILRHRSFSFQEFSQRYAKAMGFELKEARLQDTKNRQNSLVTENKELNDLWTEAQESIIAIVQAVYDGALEEGIAKEVARSILPEGLTTSRLYMAGTLRSWFHYCALRMGNGTQLEHQLIAEDCWKIIQKEFPSIAVGVENGI